ncbi:hypothetical protein [Streptomyces mirabilis]|uniref:hypothetical protein n=1 Tax=Streptomyces mirabilis TaxID=68239 RepID=UPI0036C25098
MAELPKIGDRVRHADGTDSVAVVKRFPSYPLATVEWEDTGRESSENVYLLIKVDD